ncbi:MAG: ABC transporter ATP-binding protein [Ignavibacteriales bacterium]
MAEVILKNVTKLYEGNPRPAVRDVTIEVHDKEFVVLVGPSGCGKSTTLRMIAGLEEITSGELFIDGRLVNDISPKDRDIAMVFQNYALYPHMSVYENMAFGLKLRKFPKPEIKERVLEAARILEIEELLERKPKALSGGQRQRVAVGRAIVRKPKVFLFDEPLSNLDAKLRVQMRTEISRLHQNLQATMIYVTHDQTEAMTMGDRIVVMKDGDIQQIDTPLGLYNSPVNRFVAGFMGSPPMNFLTGEVKKDDMGVSYFKDTDGILNLKLSKSVDEGQVIMGMRSEDIQDSNYQQNPSYQPIDVTLELVEPMGNEIFLYFRIAQRQIVARIAAREKPNPGTSMRLYINTDKLHFFNPETEKAL